MDRKERDLVCTWMWIPSGGKVPQHNIASQSTLAFLSQIKLNTVLPNSCIQKTLTFRGESDILRWKIDKTINQYLA